MGMLSSSANDHTWNDWKWRGWLCHDVYMHFNRINTSKLMWTLFISHNFQSLHSSSLLSLLHPSSSFLPPHYAVLRTYFSYLDDIVLRLTFQKRTCGEHILMRPLMICSCVKSKVHVILELYLAYLAFLLQRLSVCVSTDWALWSTSLFPFSDLSLTATTLLSYIGFAFVAVFFSLCILISLSTVSSV